MTKKIKIQGEIGWDFTALDLSQELQGAKGDLHIKLDSFGGSVFDGVSIYQQLVNYEGGKITVEIGAKACSIASVIAMCANELIIHESSTMMIHRASTFAAGNAVDLEKTAKFLDAIDVMIVKFYSTWLSDSVATIELIKMFRDETWFVGSDAIKSIFDVTKVIPNKANEAKTKAKTKTTNVSNLHEDYRTSYDDFVKHMVNANKDTTKCIDGVCQMLDLKL